MIKMKFKIEEDLHGRIVAKFVDTNGAISRMSFQQDRFGVGVKNVESYAESLVDHIAYVREAGKKLNIDPVQLMVHDHSKFSLEEFPHYARQYHGDKGDPSGYARAWLHHIHNNSHHWQHWMYPDGFTPKGSNVENGVVFMPDNYAQEMIADWMGASMAHTGSWDMQEWLWSNMPRITLHSQTAHFVRGQLDLLGYSVVWERPFKRECVG